MRNDNYEDKLRDAVIAHGKSTVERFSKADSILLNPRDKPKQKSTIVRDTFSMPPSDYALIKAMQKRANNLKNKSEIIRAGLYALQNMADTEFSTTISQLEKMMPGPKS